MHGAPTMPLASSRHDGWLVGSLRSTACWWDVRIWRELRARWREKCVKCMPKMREKMRGKGRIACSFSGLLQPAACSCIEDAEYYYFITSSIACARRGAVLSRHISLTRQIVVRSNSFSFLNGDPYLRFSMFVKIILIHDRLEQPKYVLT